MSGPQRKELALVDTVAPTLNDTVVTIQSNKVKRSLYSAIYNLFKQGYDTVYVTTVQLANYATQTFATNAANTAQNNAIASANGYTDTEVATKQPKQSTNVIGINAQGGSTLSSANCILSISNISSGTGNKEISINTGGFINDGDFLQLTIKYNGFDVNLRSYTIQSGVLKLFINVHSNPAEPVIISMNKIS